MTFFLLNLTFNCNEDLQILILHNYNIIKLLLLLLLEHWVFADMEHNISQDLRLNSFR